MQTQLSNVQLKLVVPPTQASLPLLPPANAPSTKVEQFLQVFESVTGWKAEFHESLESLKHRSQPNMESAPAQGSFSIVDMSVDWPAKKPTCHRAKCDQLMELFESLVYDLESTKLELARIRSCMAGLVSTEESLADEILTDSFVPKFDQIELQTSSGNRSQTEDDSFELNYDLLESEDSNSDWESFELQQPLDSCNNNNLVSVPFAGWTLGGNTGIVGDDYLDWSIDQDERIEIVVGKIESAFGEGDPALVIKVDPLTSEFRCGAIGGAVAVCYDEPNLNQSESDSTRKMIHGFLLLDSVKQTLVPVEPASQWHRLKVGDAIIGCTNELDLVQLNGKLPKNDPTKELSAAEIANLVQGDERDLRVVVLLRS